MVTSRPHAHADTPLPVGDPAVVSPSIGPSFSTTVQPSLDTWPKIAAPWRNVTPKRPADLLAIVNQNAALFGCASLVANDAPLWVTGHQAWLWHPGILAKDLVAAAAARRMGGDVLHLVVDHDIHDALHMDLPLQQDQQLQTHSVTLATTRADIPSACQPPVDLAAAIEKIRHTREKLSDASKVKLDTLQKAMEAVAADRDSLKFETLGQQMAAITGRLLAPWTGQVAILLTSQLCELDGFNSLRQAMLNDAPRCATAYNRAVLAHPQAGIGTLAMDRQLVELPLWLLTWQRRRQPVYADITDSTPLLVTADGNAIETGNGLKSPRLAPRAMLLTAVIRRYYASVFVHGTGGGVYDQVTEAWWSGWRGSKAGDSSSESETLAPMAVATADLRLPFDLPVANQQDVLDAQQRVHHLKHNLNLEQGLSDEAQQLAADKEELLGHMHDDRDVRRRQASFKAILAINDQLGQLMPDVLTQADEALERAKIGLNNRKTAMRRDWPFVIYSDDALAYLARAMGLDESLPQNS